MDIMELSQEEMDYLEAREILGRNVDRGEIFLDSVDPEWYKKVNISNVSMGSASLCICGYVFKDLIAEMSGFEYFEREYEAKGLGYDSEYGFNACYRETNHLRNEPNHYSVLAELWVEKIEKRLANDGLMIEGK